MKSGTEIVYCPICRAELWRLEPVEFRSGDGVVLASFSPLHFPELRERKAVQHFTQAHPHRWRLSQRQFVVRRPWLFKRVLGVWAT